MTRTRVAVLMAVVASALMLPACSYGSGSYGSGAPAAKPTKTLSTTDQPADTTAGGQRAGAGKADAVRLAATTVGGLGEVVTDGEGRTLYLFDKDGPDPRTSACNGACAGLWPPLLAFSDEVQALGVNPALIGTVTRQDGSKQVTLNRRPLYRYAKDTAPGEAKGQGVGGTWFAATPQGAKAAETPAAAGSPAGNGYDY
jgi:predicted lipoprotein with Yx(FWY)xxD motif